MKGHDLFEILLMALLILYCLGNSISTIKRMVLHRRVNRMTNEIRDRIASTGHLIPPDDIVPGAYNVAGRFPEYIFTEERNDAYGERMIFISKDCKHISVMPWRSPCDNSSEEWEQSN